MAIVFVGMPGSGKSTVGRLLARESGLPFADSDVLIEQASQMSIPEYFRIYGEKHFRELEEECIAEALENPGVLSLGGGAVLSPRIRANLASHEVIYLDVNLEELQRRLERSKYVRPLLAEDMPGKLAALYKERVPLYREVARHTITSRLEPPAILLPEIMKHLGMNTARQQRKKEE